MPVRFRDRSRRPGRRDAYRDPANVILVVCEGSVTEKQYVIGFHRSYRKTRVEVKVSDEHGVPRTLVEVAKRLKLEAEERARRERDEFLKYDAVWCMFDIDEHPHVSDAKQMAIDNDIKLAISNPCFELWLLLHFRESPGANHRHDLQRMLRQFIPGYDKRIACEGFLRHWTDAERRAIGLDQLAESIGDPGRNPSTGVYKLLQTIVGFPE
jgi:hypothetical protein